MLRTAIAIFVTAILPGSAAAGCASSECDGTGRRGATDALLPFEVLCRVEGGEVPEASDVPADARAEDARADAPRPDAAADLPAGDARSDLADDPAGDHAPYNYCCLCDPCDGHEDCGGAGNFCIVNDETGEIFCGGECEEDRDCPGFYMCRWVHSCAGDVRQCVPQSGTCR